MGGAPLGQRVVALIFDAALQAALQRLTGGAAVRTFVSSRTDVGVHAYANTLHFDLTRITRRGEPVRSYRARLLCNSGLT